METIARIRKRPGSNAFASMITVGRANNNDISIPANMVSKFHGYFMIGPDRSVSLTDAGSTNGTFHKGRKLEARTECVKLQSGDQVGFGELKTVFLTSAGAWDRFRVMADLPPQPTKRGGVVISPPFIGGATPRSVPVIPPGEPKPPGS
jgi:pSer/pThr/pTyr-binding forkhead associated (FHA) protein